MSSYSNSSKFAALDEDYNSSDFIPVKSKSNKTNINKNNSFKPFNNLTSSNNINSYSTSSNSNSNGFKTYTNNTNKHHKYKYEKLSRSVKDSFTYIISKSSNDLKSIESSLIELYNKMSDNVDKCSLIELILSYSLHELVQSKDSFFGKIIFDNFSVYNEDNLDKLKLKDGYTLFAYSVWIATDKDKNISRSQSDIISTVIAILNLDVNPFKLGKKKKETIFDTMDVCLSKNKITNSSYNSICELIFTKKYNSELFFGKYLNQFLSTNTSIDTKFMHNVLIFGLLNDFNSNKDLFKSLYNSDINSLGLLSLNIKTGIITDKNLYFTNILKIIKLFDFNQSGFKNFFKNSKDMKREFHLLKVSLANYYIESMISDNSSGKFIQYDISNGSKFSSNSGNYYFNFLEIIGFLIDEVSTILDTNFDEACLNKFDIKIQIGYGISKFINSKTHKEYLTKLYESNIHIRNKMLIGSIIGIESIKDMNINIKSINQEEKEEKNNIINFKVDTIGLDKLTEGDLSLVNFEKNQLSPSIDDFFYKLSIFINNNSNKINTYEVAKEILYKLFELVCKKYQVELVSDFLAYMHQKKLIKKDDLKKVLSLNKDEITDFFSCDNMFFDSILNKVESC